MEKLIFAVLCTTVLTCIAICQRTEYSNCQACTSSNELTATSTQCFSNNHRTYSLAETDQSELYDLDENQ
jgi:hypothetical protein